MDHISTGQLGEKTAGEYLKKRGYKIIERNFKTKYAEIDLVGEKDKTLVFFEVRTKRGEDFGSPEDTLNGAKLKQMVFASRIYCAAKKWPGPCRIDAVCIVLGSDNRPGRISHYENVA